MTAHTVLRIDSSARHQDSVSRRLTDQVIERLAPETVVTRDLSNTLPLIDEAWIGANFTPADKRSPEQRETLALSDSLIDELKAADTLVIGLPIYNFAAPTTFKAWVDLVARAGVTFRYSEAGPEGLLTGKRAILVVTSGGTAVGSEIDFASGYVKHVLSFIGITDIEVVTADRLAVDPEGTVNKAEEQVARLAA
ncbi:FMN-dependent NADH-azoreductase [Litorisediminicola beolgyonensis]|uniref:FMN dependent NADH:quinone oxidoreductase n=1 Tax=Litorisediminicola beolgyonensis TaxID=1173614 RepID=A0ABW3ZIC6_9RHOB